MIHIGLYHQVGGNYAYKPMQNNSKSSQIINYSLTLRGGHKELPNNHHQIHNDPLLQSARKEYFKYSRWRSRPFVVDIVACVKLSRKRLTHVSDTSQCNMSHGYNSGKRAVNLKKKNIEEYKTMPRNFTNTLQETVFNTEQGLINE